MPYILITIPPSSSLRSPIPFQTPTSMSSLYLFLENKWANKNRIKKKVWATKSHTITAHKNTKLETVITQAKAQ